MIKTDIKELFVNIGDNNDVRAILPFSIASLIDDEVLPESCAEEKTASFCAYFSIDLFLYCACRYSLSLGVLASP